MMLMERYQKQGLLQFTLVKGSLAGLAFAILLGLQPEIFDSISVPFFVVGCFVFGYLLAFGMWFFTAWYFGRIKKRLLDSGELKQI